MKKSIAICARLQRSIGARILLKSPAPLKDGNFCLRLVRENVPRVNFPFQIKGW